jgi:hypothetical protein
MNKYLIVVRAGDKSLHPQWIEKNRNWDIAVSYYGDHPDRYKDQYDYLHLFKGSKWQGLSDFITNNKSLIDSYEYVWFPDDDLFCSCEYLNNFFNISACLDLTISQPALTSYSYYSWAITLQSSTAEVRITDFVEIMAPCFKGSLFKNFSSTFSENTSGFGYEWLWKKIAIENNIFRFGIVDSTPIFHSRKVGAAGHGGSVTSPQMEMNLLMQKFKILPTQPEILSVIELSKNVSL